jgi:hypothetical protein
MMFELFLWELLMKLSQLLFGIVGFALLFGSAGYFHGEQVKTDRVSSFETVSFDLLFGSTDYLHGEQVKTDRVSSFETAHVMQADVFDFKTVEVSDVLEASEVSDVLEMRDVVQMAEVILFKQPKFDVTFTISENEINRINENIAVIDIENIAVIDINANYLQSEVLNANVEFLYKFENLIELAFSKMEKPPVPLLSLKSCEKTIKKIEPKKSKTVCPQKKSRKLNSLKRFKKSASWI